MSYQTNSVEITLNPSSLEYVLYVNSKWRSSLNISMEIADFMGDGPVDYNPLPYIKDNFLEEYNLIIDIYKKHAPSKWFYMGCSETGIVSWFQYPGAAKYVQDYLSDSLPGAKIVKIVFTEELDEKAAPICAPLLAFHGKYMKLKYSPCLSKKDEDAFAFTNVIGVIECNERWWSFINPTKLQKRLTRVLKEFRKKNEMPEPPQLPETPTVIKA